eukprot:Awhi_evm1s14388
MSVIYDDDASFGKTAPDMSSLDYVTGSPVELGVQPTLVVFWAKINKDAYVTFIDYDDLAAKYPELKVIGVSLDATRADIEGFVKKFGTDMAELSVTNLNIKYPLAFDEGKVVKKAFEKLSGIPSLQAGACFLIDAEKKIVWRESFNRYNAPSKSGQLKDQLDAIMSGKPIIYKNGKTPEDSESDDDMGDGGDYEDMF